MNGYAKFGMVWFMMENLRIENDHFNTFQVHELKINYDSGQDYINVDQTVLIAYSASNRSQPKVTDWVVLFGWI